MFIFVFICVCVCLPVSACVSSNYSGRSNRYLRRKILNNFKLANNYFLLYLISHYHWRVLQTLQQWCVFGQNRLMVSNRLHDAMYFILLDWIASQHYRARSILPFINKRIDNRQIHGHRRRDTDRFKAFLNGYLRVKGINGTGTRIPTSNSEPVSITISVYPGLTKTILKRFL